MNSIAAYLPDDFPVEILTTRPDKLVEALDTKDVHGHLLTLFLKAVVTHKNQIKIEKDLYIMWTDKTIKILEKKRGTNGFSSKDEAIFLEAEKSLMADRKSSSGKRKAEEGASAENEAKKSKIDASTAKQSNDKKRKAPEHLELQSLELQSKKPKITPSPEAEAPKFLSFKSVGADVIGVIGGFLEETTDLHHLMETERATAGATSQIISSSKTVMKILKSYSWDIATIEKDNLELYKDLQKYSSKITELQFPEHADLNEEKLRGILKVFTNLKGLSFEEEKDINRIPIKAFPNNLQYLSMKNWNLHDEHLEQIAQQCPHLQRLDLSWCINITDEGIKAVAQQCPHLHSLDLESCDNITDKGFEELAQRCPHLQSLNLFSCNITNKGLKALAQWCPNLESLNLGCCKEITNEGLKELVVKCPHLKSLNLNNCDNITDECLKDLVPHFTHLKSLNLAKCANISDEGLEALAMKCTQLHRLTLHDCTKITNKGLIELATYCTQLNHLSLSNCNITGIGLKVLAEKCRYLTYVTCSKSSKISEECIAQLAVQYPRLHINRR
jgi:hypothetical protein